MSAQDVERDDDIVVLKVDGLVGFINDLRAECDRLTARVQELEALDVFSQRIRAEAAEAENAKLREALEASDGLIRLLRPDLSHTRPRADEVVARNRAALADPFLPIGHETC